MRTSRTPGTRDDHRGPRPVPGLDARHLQLRVRIERADRVPDVDRIEVLADVVLVVGPVAALVRSRAPLRAEHVVRAHLVAAPRRVPVREREVAPAAGSQHARHLVDHRAGAGCVLEHVGAEHAVERPGRAPAAARRRRAPHPAAGHPRGAAPRRTRRSAAPPRPRPGTPRCSSRARSRRRRGPCRRAIRTGASKPATASAASRR